MHRISVTTVEKFRRYMDSVSPRDTEEELLQTIKGVFIGNDLTRTGGAYHKIIEQEAEIAEGGLIAESDGARIYFTAEQAEPAIEYKRRHMKMVHEVSVRKVYDTKIGPVLISGRLDGAEGIHIRDVKCKFGPLKLEEYSDSYQWRFYLDMMEMPAFFYDFFEFAGFDGLKGDMPYQLHGVMVADPMSMPLYSYDRMGKDCLQLLNEFVDYLAFRNLFGFLKQEPAPSLVS